MKIAFINFLYPPQNLGGPAFAVRDLAEQLAAEGHRPTVICRNIRSTDEVEQVRGVQVFRISASESEDGAAKRAGEILAEQDVTLAHTFYLRGFALRELAAQLSQRHHVHNLQDYSLICKTGVLYRDGRRCEPRCDVCAVDPAETQEFERSVDSVISVSRFTLERHRSAGLFRNTPARVIGNCYRPRPPAPKSGNRRSFTAGYLGRIAPSKGLELVLRARAHCEQFDLKIAGRGDPAYLRSLQSSYSMEGVTFTGFLEPQELFAGCDAAIIPSVCFEAQSRVIAEANAQGIPVVAARIGGIPEYVDEGVNGFLYDADSPTALAAILRRLIESPSLAASMREGCLGSAESALPEAIAARCREVYESLLKGEA